MTECRAFLFTGSVQAKHQAAGAPKVWARDAHTLEPQMTQMSADAENRKENLHQSGSSAASYTAGRLEFPTLNIWNLQFFTKVTGTEVQVHHAVEKYVQKLIGVNTQLRVANGAKLKNTCPGIPLPRNKKVLDDINAGQLPQHQLKAVHRALADDGIAELIRKAIPPGNPAGLSPQGMIQKLRQIYNEHDDLANQWPVARDWLKKVQTQGHLDANLNIPD